MNANPVHLDLDDLIAEAAGQGIDDQAREHLAGCEHCQREARRWNLVASGIRDLAAEAAEPAGPAEPARRPRTGRRRVLAGPWKPVLAAVGSVAAAFLVLVGIGVGAGLVHVHLNGSGPGSQTSLTAVSGCARLQQTAGTLERVKGVDVVIRTASGHLVTVTTTATTRLAASGPLLADITDGVVVSVAGTGSGGTIAADLVVVGAHASLTIPGIATVRGTVADAGAAGFTVVTSAGTRVPVTTTGATAVTVMGAKLGQLRIGASTKALGYAGPDGTLSALVVAQPSGWPPGAHSTISVSNCSSTAINHAILALASGG
jgi:hypothetical protein